MLVPILSQVRPKGAWFGGVQLQHPEHVAPPDP
jgi:hypothetical protein